MSPADPANAMRFTVGSTLTVTMGPSGAENVDVSVHDCAAVGPGSAFLANGSHGSPWLSALGSQPTVAWVRFDWRAALVARAGLTSSADILDASITLHGEWGDSQVVEARRCLQPWNDDGHGDFYLNNPVGAPSWANNINGTHAWNRAGCLATAPGVEGRTVADYGGAQDTALTPDAVAAMPATNEPLVISGPAVTDAVRFWFDNPSVDYGYALRLAAGSVHESKFHASEALFGELSPTLTITYAVPATANAPPPEVSSPLAAVPLRVVKEPGGLIRVSFEDLGALATGYHVYQGTVGARAADPADWYSHAPAACAAATSPGPGSRELVMPMPAGGAYLLADATNGCVEGSTGSDSRGRPHPAPAVPCGP